MSNIFLLLSYLLHSKNNFELYFRFFHFPAASPLFSCAKHQFLCKHQSILLHQKRHVQMFPIQHLMSLGNRDILTVHNSLLRVLRIFFNVHIITPISSKHKHFYPISFIFSDSDMLSIPSQLCIYPLYTRSNAK